MLQRKDRKTAERILPVPMSYMMDRIPLCRYNKSTKQTAVKEGRYAFDPGVWTGEAYGENEFPDDVDLTGEDYGENQDLTGEDYGENQDLTGENYGENQDLTGEDYGENQDLTGEDYGENQN